MNLEILNAETLALDQPVQYQFVVDSDLAYVGGGGGLLDY